MSMLCLNTNISKFNQNKNLIFTDFGLFMQEKLIIFSKENFSHGVFR